MTRSKGIQNGDFLGKTFPKFDAVRKAGLMPCNDVG